MIQKANKSYQTPILNALSATVSHYAESNDDVINKHYLETRLSSIQVLGNLGTGIEIGDADTNSVRTLSSGTGVTILSSADTIIFDTKVKGVSSIGSGISVYNGNNSGTAQFNSLSGGYGINVKTVDSLIVVEALYEKTLTYILSTAGSFNISIPYNTYGIEISAFGGGGGGGGGGYGYVNGAGGGGGGGGGAVNVYTLDKSVIGSSLDIIIGTGGVGGAGGTSLSGSGGYGANGTPTIINCGTISLSTLGGNGGTAGNFGGATGGAGGTPNGGSGGRSGNYSGGFIPPLPGTSLYTGGGGGGGGIAYDGYDPASGGISTILNTSIGGTGGVIGGRGVSGTIGSGGGGGGGRNYYTQTMGGDGGNGGDGYAIILVHINEGKYINIGSGTPLINGEMLGIRSLSSATTDIAILSSTDTITLSALPITGGSVGAGVEVFNGRYGNTLEFSTLSAGNNCSVYKNGDTIVIDADASTLANVGLGTGIFKQKIDSTAEFYSLSAGKNVNISLISDTIVISTSSTSGSGSGEPVYYTPIGNGVQLIDANSSIMRGLSAVGSIVLLSSTDTIILSGGASGGSSDVVYGETAQVYDINGNMVEVGTTKPQNIDMRNLWLFS